MSRVSGFMDRITGRYGKQRVIFFALLILWAPWGILCFPGNLPWDAGTSIAWFLGIDRSEVNNPWFQNLLMGAFYKAGEGIGAPALGTYLYCWGQMLLEAWVLSRVIGWLAEHIGAGKWAYLLILFFALPVFPIYAFMMGKDSSYALAMLWMVFLLVRWAVEREAFEAKKGNIAWLTALPVILGLLRNLGGVIPLIVFAVLALMKLKKAGILPALLSALLLFVFTFAVPKLAGIPDGQIREQMSMPLQTVGYYVQEHPDEVTDEEKEIISKVVDYDVLAENYTPAIADPVKNRAEFTPETRTEFLRMWRGMLAKHPGTILEGWRRSTDLYFSFTQISTVKSHYFIGVSYDPVLQEQLGIRNWEQGNYLAKGAYYVSMNIPELRTLQLPGLYSWITILMTLCALVFRRIRKFLPGCILLLMVLGACLLSPVNGYFRYAYPMILPLPIILTSMLGSIKKTRID